MILHCMKKSTYEERKNKETWGKRNLEADGFIHCSQAEFFWRVAPNFKEVSDELVLVCIDESKIKSILKYEDDGNYGRAYPHVYGLIPREAVIGVLPFLKDENGNWIKNPELSEYRNQ